LSFKTWEIRFYKRQASFLVVKTAECKTRYINKCLNNTGIHLFVKVPRPGDSEGTFSVYYQSNHSKVEAIPLSALLKDTTSELAGLASH